MRTGEVIPDEILKRPASGVSLAPGPLGDQLGSGPNLLVFLRHFGCIFCRETIADLRAVAERDERFPDTLFFFQGSPTEGRALLRSYWPAARAVADPEGAIYGAFGIGRGGPLQMFGPAVWTARSRARAKGHRNGSPSGDVWRMPGVFLTEGTRIVWTHEYAHAADHPDYQEIAERAAALRH
jgi:hypothetical protein